MCIINISVTITDIIEFLHYFLVSAPSPSNVVSEVSFLKAIFLNKIKIKSLLSLSSYTLQLI